MSVRQRLEQRGKEEGELRHKKKMHEIEKERFDNSITKK